MASRAVNPSHARQEREERAERHRVRQLLKTSAGARQWVREAQRELDNWLAGLPADVIEAVRDESTRHGSEIQRIVQEALDQRATPSALASRVYHLVADRLLAEQAQRPPCAACGHGSVHHSLIGAEWCYECRRECCYQEPAADSAQYPPAGVPDFARW